MAIQRTAVDTGIYKRGTITASGGDAAKAIKHLERRVRRQNENWLPEAIRVAKETLASPTATEPTKYDAEECLVILDVLRKAYREGRWVDALCEAYWLGRFTEALYVRRQEHHALRGRKTLAATKKAARKRLSRFRALRPIYQKAIDEYLKRNPRHSYEVACTHVAEKQGICTRTVKRWANNPKKNRKS